MEKIRKILMNSEKLINSFKIFFYQFINNLSKLLLGKKIVPDIFDVGNFFQIFIVSRSTKILIESNFRLEMCVIN